MKKTKWFSYATPPKRKGWYECTCGLKHMWGGKSWLDFNGTYATYRWRGLREQAQPK